MLFVVKAVDMCLIKETVYLHRIFITGEGEV